MVKLQHKSMSNAHCSVLTIDKHASVPPHHEQANATRFPNLYFVASARCSVWLNSIGRSKLYYKTNHLIFNRHLPVHKIPIARWLIELSNNRHCRSRTQTHSDCCYLTHEISVPYVADAHLLSILWRIHPCCVCARENLRTNWYLCD